MYASFLFQHFEGGWSGLRLGVNGAYNSSDNFNIGVSSGGPFLLSWQNYPTLATWGPDTTSTYLLVTKLVFHAGSTKDEFYLKVYSPTATVGSEPTTWDIADKTNISSSSTYDRIWLDEKADARAAFDEIRIGTTWADVTVVPEPSTIVMLLSMLCGMLIYAWRRR